MANCKKRKKKRAVFRRLCKTQHWNRNDYFILSLESQLTSKSENKGDSMVDDDNFNTHRARVSHFLIIS